MIVRFLRLRCKAASRAWWDRQISDEVIEENMFFTHLHELRRSPPPQGFTKKWLCETGEKLPAVAESFGRSQLFSLTCPGNQPSLRVEVLFFRDLSSYGDKDFTGLHDEGPSFIISSVSKSVVYTVPVWQLSHLARFQGPIS